MRSARRHRTKQKYHRWGYIVHPLIYVVAFQTIAEHIKCQGAIIGLSIARSDTLDNNGKMTNPCRSLSHLLSLVYFVGTLTLLQGGALYKMVSSVIHHRSLIASYCYKLMFWKNKCGEGRELGLEAGQWVGQRTNVRLWPSLPSSSHLCKSLYRRAVRVAKIFKSACQ